MRKYVLLLAVLGLAASGFSQGVRVDPFPSSTVNGVIPGGAYPPLLIVPGTQVTLCRYPASGYPCTNFAVSYTDATLTTACPTATPAVWNGSSSCVNSVDSQGKFGFWVAAGNYSYMLTNTATGQINGPFSFSAGGSGGGGTGSPGGSPGSLQYNLAGAFAGFSGSCIPKLNGSSAPGCAVAGTDYLQSITSSLVLAALGYTPVANTITVNGHALSANVVISASDLTAGTLPHAQLPALLSADIPNNGASTTGQANTALALAGTPTLCSTGQAPTGILASGNATGCASISGGGISGLTSGYIPAATSPTAIGNSHMDDGATTAGVITSTEPIATSATGNGFKEVEAAAPSGVASSDIIYADSTAHRWKMNNNNGGAVQVVASGGDINTSDQVTVTHLTAPQTVPQGGTGVGTGTGYAYGNGTSAFTFSTTIPYGNLSGTPTLAATLAKVSHQWLDSYTSSTGLFTQSQPAFTDVSGSVAAGQMPALTGDCTTSAGAVATTCTKTSGTAFGPLATVTTTTGSGAGVLATSPSLITPNIGVATATSTGGSGTPTLAVGAASGTGATVTANATYPNDNTEGVLTLVTGTGPATGTLATVTFSITRAKAPVCMVQLESATGQMTSVTQAATTTALTISAGTALAASSGYGILYLCGGN